MAIRNKARREAIARHRLKRMLEETPLSRRRSLRLRLARSMGYGGKPKTRSDAITAIARGRRGRWTELRMRRVNEWYRRRALGQVPGVDVPDINARDYTILYDNERMNLAGMHISDVDADTFAADPDVWTIPPPPNLIIDTVAHIRSFAYAVIQYGGGLEVGASFMIPWGDMLRKAVGTDIRKLFARFNAVIYDAFMSPPPDGGYRILALAFNNAGAQAIAAVSDTEVDAYGYGIFLESRRRPKGQTYKLKTVSL